MGNGMPLPVRRAPVACFPDTSTGMLSTDSRREALNWDANRLTDSLENRMPRMFRSTLQNLLIVGLGCSAVAIADSANSASPPKARFAELLPKWQRGALKAPDIAEKVVALPATRPFEALAATAPEDTAGVDKVGYVEDLDANLSPTWNWTRRADGTDAARVRFASRGACGLRLQFEGIDPKAQIEMRFFDEAGESVLGPFVSPRVDEQGGWWSPTIWGEVAGVELIALDGVRPEAAQPQVVRVAYLNQGGSCGVTPGQVLSCNNDIQCHNSWANGEGRGVALFYNIKDGVCLRWTGALLARQPGDFSPLFMTSNFACGTSGEADSVEVYWEYETDACNGAFPATPANQPRNLGAVRIKRHVDADWSLLALLDPPAASNPDYLGWNSGSWSDNATATVIHHPRGSFKRISFGETGILQQVALCLSILPGGCFDVDSRRVNTSDGPTELGSTGAPVVDSNRQVRLVISGRVSDSWVCADAPFRSYGGRLDQAYDHLKYALADAFIASPTYVNNTAVGDDGGNGILERGVVAAPYTGILEASFVVRAGDELRINPGNYTGRVKIWRPMKLKRDGTSGSVRMGI